MWSCWKFRWQPGKLLATEAMKCAFTQVPQPEMMEKRRIGEALAGARNCGGDRLWRGFRRECEGGFVHAVGRLGKPPEDLPCSAISAIAMRGAGGKSDPDPPPLEVPH